MKKTYILIFLIVISVGIVAAHSDEDFAQAEKIISQNISCQGLSSEQLEMLGDYFMEQIHPGEAHEYMDQMMGGEGSESLKQMHINMAYRFYCTQNEGSKNYEEYGMMSSNGMMGGGMIGSEGYNLRTNSDSSNSYSGMMGNLYSGTAPNIFSLIVGLLVIIVLILLIVLLIKKIQSPRRRR